MTGRGKDAVVTGLVFAALAILSASGCGGLRVGITGGRRDQPIEPPAEQVAAPGSEPADGQSALLAVEEFLRRTEDYQSADGARVGAPAGLAAAAHSTTEAQRTTTSKPSGVAAETASGAAPSSDAAFANTQLALADTPLEASGLAPPVVESVSIRSQTEMTTSRERDEEASTKTTNQALDMRAPDASMTVDGFLRHLELQAQERPDSDVEWKLRLVELALNRDTETPEDASEVWSGERGILDAVIRAVDAARHAALNPMAPGEEAVNRAEELVHVLAGRADPIVPVVALCRKVVTFGVYDEMGEESFVAGRSTRTIVYCEVRNFGSEKTDEGLYRTVLATRLEVLTADGQSVWQHEEPEIVDVCRRRRTDFFIAQRTTLPPELAVGDYVLKVLVEDRLSGKADEAVHPFSVGASTSLAVRR